MQPILDFISANSVGILAVIAATHALAVAVVNLTPTPTDDAYVAKIYGWVEFAAGILTSKAKQ